ncbi:helix-turn-helix domain-containing protein [Pediococcus acidilactici]|jgi:transcriptional regulator with XRE-family HTH domain|uniref:Helix-turn-helix transcriptional regulator n=1 Tax=Pediococcus acidilactici TaxID=1254 RepID=A0AAW8YPM0_PEDAC|nr:helix-turn-helix transcriptional regulator [Pediococcus acidilactici]KAF0362563.1 helix-turn-helix domain-containing protein [Pediococcus acidilactici]KAF0368149.1 helix-turn-helix domain-containing protein [Pediococcus acidilactici]KAF0372788.1 helix-turn-helix domain-containing protein [Pediococcus acidilactici]KAF0383341.1 helix-turn-helix domain-containing protein [Pediococcus acidilactici]KAF0417267.1 helix-turn-helix domain-containing protein [Pediococcus acidilactici]
MNPDEILRNKLAQLITENNMNKTSLAKKLGIDNSALSRILSGERKVTTEELNKIAIIFDVTTDYLLGKNNTPKWANKKDTTDLKKFLEDNDGTFTYGGDDLTEDEKQKLKIAMTQIFWDRHKHD